jgi:excisionase family DNA binding protein
MNREETIGKAAKLLGIPRTTLQSAVERGDIPTRKLEGGTVLVELHAAEKWVKNGRRPGPGRPPIE